MPIYTYTCSSCNTVIEKRQSFSDPPLSTCEQCGGSLRKVIHPVGIVFKGSGWYITDSRSSTSSSTNGTSSSTTSPAEGSSNGTAGAASSSTSTSTSTSTSSAEKDKS